MSAIIQIREIKIIGEVPNFTGNIIQKRLPSFERDSSLWSKTKEEKIKVKKAKLEFKKNPKAISGLDLNASKEENLIMHYYKTIPENKRLIGHNGRKHHGRRKRTYKKYLKSLK